MASFSLPELPSAAALMDMTSSPEISVIVLLFNEAESMSILQAELGEALSGFNHEIIFVDDGSVDDGAAEASRDSATPSPMADASPMDPIM